MNVNMVITEETKWVSYGLTRVLKIHGFNNNDTDDRFIQFHAKPAAAIANGDVPAVKSYWCGAESAFYWECNVDLSELSIAISSTEESYTAVTNTGLDLTAQVETEYPVISGVTTLVGDLTTGVSALTVWADAAGPKKLKRLTIVNAGGASIWAAVRASTSRTSNDTTVLLLPEIESSGTGDFFFGGGYTPFRAGPSAATVHDGCFVEYRLTPVYSADDEAGTDLNIRAIYE